MNKFHFGSTHDTDLLYLLQYEISDAFFYFASDTKQYVFLSALDIDAFKEFGNLNISALPIEPFRDKAVQNEISLRISIALEILAEFNAKEKVSVSTRFPLDMADALREHGYALEVEKNWLPKREIKTNSEIDYIRKNMETTCSAFKLVEEILGLAVISGEEIIYKGDVLTSEYVQEQIESFFFENGYLNPEGLIVSCGVDSAKPHHHGAGAIRPHQSVVVDLFPQSRKNHYFADMTRTYVKGVPSKELQAMYEAVSLSKSSVLDVLKPGCKASKLHALSASVITEAGFDVGERGYIHSLGHGLGVDIHEAPHLGPKSLDILKVGQVITIEPGLYYPDVGGVRIEDTIVVTKGGYENLTNYPENWIIA